MSKSDLPPYCERCISALNKGFMFTFQPEHHQLPLTMTMLTGRMKKEKDGPKHIVIVTKDSKTDVVGLNICDLADKHFGHVENMEGLSDVVQG